MNTKLTKMAVPLALVAALAVTAPAMAAKGVAYKGKTSSGHVIKFTVKNNRVHDLVGGIRMACISIQGGGTPMGGMEVFGFRGSVPLKAHNRYTSMEKPAFYWNKVTMNNDLWLKRSGTTITGRMRLQYEFLVSKYPIGTFSIYSCLGGATFKAKPVR